MSDEISVNMNVNLGKDKTVDDIVTRLRQEWEYGNLAKGCDYEMFAQAADEIEALRADITRILNLASRLVGAAEEQIDELRGNQPPTNPAWLAAWHAFDKELDRD